MDILTAAGIPARYDLERTRMNLNQAYRYCARITRQHYENFPVASVLLPAHYRKPISAIYAFARTADDFSDEEGNRQKLLDWRRQLQECTLKTPQHPIFFALSDTITRFRIPLQWLDDLLTAFLMDLEQVRPGELNDLYHYCHFSANPVGRLVLWIFGYQSESLMAKADYITTALQLTNFWQDISIDLKKDRIYIPESFLERYHLHKSDLVRKVNTDNFSALMAELISETFTLFRKGLPLLHSVHGRLNLELRLTILGGLAILQKTFRYRNQLLTYRPVLTRWEWVKIVSRMA